MKTFLASALILGLALARSAPAQRLYNAEVNRNRLQTDDGYRQRTNDDRYEGLYSLKVGAPMLDVVSVTHGPIRYELNNAAQLTIQAPALKQYKQVGISGTSFGLNKNYRLDAVVNAGGKRVIPMRDVLSPNNIYGRNLGIFGYIGEPQAPTLYIPVRASAQPGPAGAQPVQVVLLPGTRLGQFTWEYAKTANGRCTAFKDQGTGGVSSAAPDGTYPPQQPIVVQLPAGAGDELCLNVHFKALGDEQWRSKSIRVLLTSSPR